MDTQIKTRNPLTCTNSISTLSHVDGTAQKLLKRLDELERTRWRVENEIDSIMTALTVTGIKPARVKSNPLVSEAKYRINHTFADKSLTECCQLILKDYSPEWLSKSQIEYIIIRGGYKFEAKNSKNSVGVTLQRMKEEGKCEVQRVRGAHGNRYRWSSKTPDVPEAERSVNAAATKDEH